MEENFDIIQTINELEELQKANTSQLQAKINKKENLNKKQETEMEKEIQTLKKNMKNNQIYLNNM